MNRKIAALVVFPPEVTIERVQEIMKKFASEFKNPGEEPTIKEIRSFNSAFEVGIIYDGVS